MNKEIKRNEELAELITTYNKRPSSLPMGSPERTTFNQVARKIEKILDKTPWADPYEHVDLLEAHGMDNGARMFVRGWLRG